MSTVLWIFTIYTVLIIVMFLFIAKEVYVHGFQRGVYHERWLIGPNGRKQRKAQSVKVDIMFDFGKQHVLMFLPCTFAQSIDLCKQIVDNDIREAQVVPIFSNNRKKWLAIRSILSDKEILLIKGRDVSVTPYGQETAIQMLDKFDRKEYEVSPTDHTIKVNGHK